MEPRWYPQSIEDRFAQAYRDAGMEPGWTRVWRDGVDVTDLVPESDYPWPWNPSAKRGVRTQKTPPPSE